jgi:3-phosphoshikimate 1-carboxyvinyltransferase
LGAIIHVEDNRILTESTGRISAKTGKTIDCGESGTSFRFLTALAATSPVPIRLKVADSLARRPHEPLLKSLRELGASTILKPGKQTMELEVHGPLKGGETWIQGNISSQFVSGLLFASPFADSDVTIHVTGRLESSPYVEMSIAVLAQHGIKVNVNDNNSYHIPVPQKFLPAKHEVPGDFSSAAYLIAGASIAGDDITISGLKLESDHPDNLILKIIDEIGVDTRWNSDKIRVKKDKLMNFKVDATDNPDLVPVLQVLGCFADGESLITGVDRLRYKETNRLATIPNELRKMGAKIQVEDDTMMIHGPCKLTGSLLDSHHDHRVAMSCSVASLGATGDSTIQNAETVSKSYPEFYNDLTKLGVQLHVE